MLKELNHTSTYYRGLGDLTFNECYERLYKAQKQFVCWILLTVGLLIFCVVMLILHPATDSDDLFMSGMSFGTLLFFVLDIVFSYSDKIQKIKLRIKEFNQ